MTITENQARGMLLGLAVGDALGTTLEFKTVKPTDKIHTEMIGGGVFGCQPGEFTDDTSMALALGESILACMEVDPDDVMTEFVRWYRHGAHSPRGECFDIGNTTREALLTYEFSGNPYAGSTDRDASGNGALMRMAPAVILNHTMESRAIADAVMQTILTHGSRICIEASVNMAEILFDPSHLGDHFVNDPVPSGYAPESLNAAIWAVLSTDNFEKAIIAAVNLGGDADTIGAIAGQVAGRIYGVEAIPQRWIDTLMWSDKIDEMAKRLYRLGA
jgi:ADP-ribosyl-[dinitrogen reductase] hydrolase